jgi:hypothetical protein
MKPVTRGTIRRSTVVATRSRPAGVLFWALSASMWSSAAVLWCVEFVWGLEGDRSAGEHDEGECGVGGVKAVGAASDEPDLVVERFGAALVDAEADRGEDAVAVLADRLAQADERLKAAAWGAACEAIDQDGDVVDRQAGGEDGSEGFLVGVGAPCVAAGSLELAVGGGLLVG